MPHNADDYQIHMYLLESYYVGIKVDCGAFPGGAVVRNRLPMQGTQVPSLVWEDPTCRGATKLVRHND